MERCDLHSFALALHITAKTKGTFSSSLKSITFISILYIHTKRAYKPLKPRENYVSVVNSYFTAMNNIICFR